MSNLNLAIIGNCSFSALVDQKARVVWSCLPRFDDDPVFTALLNDDRDEGIFAIELLDFSHSEQAYRKNSAVLETRIYDRHGGAIEIIDFAPRFKQFGRVFRPLMLVRRVRPIAGSPRIRVFLRPVCNYGSDRPQKTFGSNHIRYLMEDMTLRLTADCPISYVLEEVPFVLRAPTTFVFGADESLTDSIEQTGRSFCENTDAYWREWCRYLALPFEWQEAVIRAAITLKLSNYEDSGAVVAAMTTSIPEAAYSGRNWDYRFCWLRDAYFVVKVMNRLGVTRTMEGYLSYIANIVATAEEGYLQPVYGILLQGNLEESEVSHLKGYRGMGPVRVGNHAYTQVQNDAYGDVILASIQSFFDHRLTQMGDQSTFERLERLGEQAVKRWDQPDAGLWELRTRQDVHTFSSVMCWAACDRLGIIAERLGLEERRSYWLERAVEIRDGIFERAFNDKLNSFVATFGGDDVDASLLLLPELGFLPPKDPRFEGTLAFAEKRLRRDKHMFRYFSKDDIGLPETAFNICTFWYIDALAGVGRVNEARELFEHMLTHRNHVGLLSEDTEPTTGELWGNFPQTYSMVGLIHSAMRLSEAWETAI